MKARRQRLLRVGSLLVLLLAVAPNVLYIGHWPGIGDSQIDTQEEAAGHTAHCHGGEQGCSQSEVFGQALPVDEASTLLLLFGGALLLAEAAALWPQSAIASRLRKPPRLIPAYTS